VLPLTTTATTTTGSASNTPITVESDSPHTQVTMAGEVSLATTNGTNTLHAPATSSPLAFEVNAGGLSIAITVTGTSPAVQRPMTLNVKANDQEFSFSVNEIPATSESPAAQHPTVLTVAPNLLSVVGSAATQHPKNFAAGLIVLPSAANSSATQPRAILAAEPILPKITSQTTTAPTKKYLPVELWMRVFEYVSAGDEFARPKFVKKYAGSLSAYGADNLQAAKVLPKFEKRTWVQTRHLYAIDRSSRAAALTLQLCLQVLQKCRHPVVPSDLLAQSDIIQDMDDIKGALGPLDLRHVAIQLHRKSNYLSLKEEASAALALIGDGVSARYCLSLGSASRVELILHPKHDSEAAYYYADEVEDVIKSFWRRYNIPAGQVEIVL
jgi:hypothetical protein